MKRHDRTPEVYYYEWSVSRWRSSETRAILDSAGRSIYREALDLCYVQGSIPKDRRILASQCGCTDEEMERTWPLIAHHFFQDKHDEKRLRNKIADVVRNNFFRHIRTQKSNSKKGGLAKANKVRQMSSDGSALVKPTEANLSQANTSQPKPIQMFGDWPATAIAIHETDPSANAMFVTRLATKAGMAFAGVVNPKIEFTDEVLAIAVRRSSRPDQAGAGLFLNTVPETIRTWATEGMRSRASPGEQIWSDLPSWQGFKGTPE